MDLAPPYHRSEPKSRTKSSSRLSKLRYYNDEKKEITSPNLSLEIVPSSPTPTMASPSPSKSPAGVPLHEILHLSPSPYRKSRTRLAERMEMAAEDGGSEPNGARKKLKSKNLGPGVAAGNGSPKVIRRSSRRRLEQDMIRDERDYGLVEDMVKPRKKRHSGRSKKEKLSVAPSTPSPKISHANECNVDGVRRVISDLVMWKDVAKSSLWFGFGSMCFLSSSFTSGVNFSIFSAISQLGLLFLGLSFFSNSVRKKDYTSAAREFKLTDEDLLRLGRLILPATNLAISKIRELFSGEPAMTLKVVPFLLLGAEYGHLLTLRKLCALGFFSSFIYPKLYSSYSVQIHKKVDRLMAWMLEAWRDCSRKKMVAVTGFMAFWHLTSIRTRIFAAFISLVIVRYSRQHQFSEQRAEVVEDGEGVKEPQVEGPPEEELQKALVVVEDGGVKEPRVEELQKALVVVETEPKKD